MPSYYLIGCKFVDAPGTIVLFLLATAIATHSSTIKRRKRIMVTKYGQLYAQKLAW